MEESAPRSLEDTQAWQSGTQNMEWNPVSSTWGGGASVKLDLMKINQDTRGDGQVIGDFSKRESGFDRYSFGKCYPVSSDVRTCFAII